MKLFYKQKAKARSDAPVSEIKKLITYTDQIAEIHNTLRKGVPITLKNGTYYLCLIPLMAGLFDYLENFGIIDMLLHYPQLSDKVIHTATFFTVLKSLFSAISFTVVIALLGILGIKRLLRKK